MTDVETSADPWAWARESVDRGALPDLSSTRVTAVVVAHESDRWLGGLLDSLAHSSLRPRRLVVVDAGAGEASGGRLGDALDAGTIDAVVAGEAGASFGANVAAGLAGQPESDYVWLLHDDVVVEADALARLVAAAQKTGASVAGPLLVEPRRRKGRAARVSELGQTVTVDGAMTGVVADGVLDQGQLEGGPVLAVNACGMLVRREVWDALGGLDPDLPSTVQGLEFCWRTRASGRAVTAAPRARLFHYEASMRGLRAGVAEDPMQQRRRWGLTLHEAFRAGPMTAADRGRVGAESARRVAGFLAGKDFLDARLERRAVREWRADRASVERLHAVFEEASASAPQMVGQIDALRLSHQALRSRRVDETFGRVVDWFAGFGDRGGGPGLEALTGDDFAREDQTRRRLSPTWIFAWVFVIGAFVASRALLSFAPLAGPQLLPVSADLPSLFGRYAAPVVGTVPSAGAPWLGLLFAPSLLTLGHVDLVVSFLLLAAVPVGFLLARRVLGRLIDEPWVVIVGAGLYGLIPVLTGAVSSGQVGTVAWTLTLPLLASLLLTWWDDRDATWPLAGGVGLAATVMTGLEPLSWLPLAAAAVGLGVRSRGGWTRVAVAAGAPALLLVSPFTVELARHPGRLLTGIDPVLGPTQAPGVLDVLLGRTVEQAPALWIGGLTFGVLWVLAVGAAIWRRGGAVWALAVAVGSAAVAVGLTRLVVTVPPTGLEARPQAGIWIVVMAAALLWGTALGLDGLRETIQGSAFGVRHAAIYAGAALSVVALAAGTLWWLASGHEGLSRTEASTIPAFIRKDTASGGVRTLALHLTGTSAGWALLEGDLGRLGDGERGLAYGGSPDADALARSVAERLAIGSADESVVADLRKLGVGYLWVTGASAEQRTAISNVPGLGVGAVDDKGANWIVPESGRVLVLAEGKPKRPDAQGALAAADAARVLVLAEPDDDWSVSVGGQRLTRLADDAGRPAFALPAGVGGTVAASVPAGFPTWALVQGLLLLGLLILSAPASPSATEARARAPRHARRRSRS